MRSSLIIIPVFTFLLLFTNTLPARYHQGIKWKEISNRHFITVFPSGYKEDAEYTLKTAEQLYQELSLFWGKTFRIRGKIRLLLSDAIDDSNGVASFFPYNHIEIYLYTPPPDSTIGSSRDWIRFVLTHELTHLIHFNAGTGFSYFLRRILGSNPVLYPSLLLPPWMAEGLSVYAESMLNEGGRLDTPEYRIMLKQIKQAGQMPDWGDFWGAPTSWPGPASRYFYGGMFTGFLAEKYGKEKIPELIRVFGYYPLPIFSARGKALPLTLHHRFKRVFGKNLNELWKEFVTSIPAAAAGGKSSITSLTTGGFSQRYPVASQQGRIYYVNRNYQEYPGIYSLDTDGTPTPRRLSKQAGINSLYFSDGQNALYYAASDYYKSYYRYSDLYRLDIKSGKVRRLSKGRRLSYPIPSPVNHTIIYSVQRVKNKSHLVLLDTGTQHVQRLSQGFEGIAYIALSPDHRTIAASVKRRDKPWAIGLFALDGKLLRVITEELDTCYYPAWKSDRELVFICQHENRYRLASTDINTSVIKIHSHLPDVRYFSFYGRDRRLLISYLSASGYNLALAALSQDYLYHEGIKDTKINPREAGQKNSSEGTRGGLDASLPPYTGGAALAAARNKKVKKYNSIRELLPKYITMYYRDGGGEYQPGLFISGQDLVSRHAYSLGFYYGLESETANMEASYTFDGLFPGFSLTYTDVTDYNRSGVHGRFTHRKRKLTLSALWPLHIRYRSQVYLYTGLHRETLDDKFPDLELRARTKLNGFAAGFLFNSSKQYYDSISAADGIHLSLSYARELKAFGSDYDINDGAIQYKQYISLFRPNVLALRLAVSDSWGEARRVFYMGGTQSYNGFITAGNNMFELMRGYPSGYFSGTGGVLLNMEYRVPLFKIENVFLLFQSLERLYITLFCDAGNLWQHKKRINPAYSLGMELNLSAYLGDIKYIISVGTAVGQRPYHKPVFFLRLGNSF